MVATQLAQKRQHASAAGRQLAFRMLALMCLVALVAGSAAASPLRASRTRFALRRLRPLPRVARVSAAETETADDENGSSLAAGAVRIAGGGSSVVAEMEGARHGSILLAASLSDRETEAATLLATSLSDQQDKNAEKKLDRRDGLTSVQPRMLERDKDTGLVEVNPIQALPKGHTATLLAASLSDFDGDEMNLFVPLGIEASTEAAMLMSAEKHVVSAASSKPIIAIIQDSLSDRQPGGYFGSAE
ncbi:hypothetical protein T492DRAFT_870234, partial [Pavlovales sp. CCMP2436]